MTTPNDSPESPASSAALAAPSGEDRYLRTTYGSHIRYIGHSRAGWPGMVDVETDDGYRTDVCLADVRRDDAFLAVFGSENCPQGNDSPGA